MTKRDATKALKSVAAYIEENGGVREQSMSDVIVLEIQTDHGAASVSLIPPAVRGGMPWLALRYSDISRIRKDIATRKLSSDVNPFSGKFNCHVHPERRTARDVADIFRQHLTRAGFPRTQDREEQQRFAAFIERWTEGEPREPDAAPKIEAPAAT